MLFIVFIVLAGTAVRCDDDSNNYYVIEMPEDDTTATKATTQKTFNVYWNVPTMQCKSKKIPFTDLYNKYGIIQNTNDTFRGEKISILYDPGLFPALLKNETSGKLKFRNGGVPQEGNITDHLEAFRSTLEQSIPDKDFSGIGIIDFESWRPVFRQNFGVLTPYKDISVDIEKKNHWWWPKTWIQNEAKARYEEAARVFMQSTVSLAKQMRPKAKWGYYGFPYCFNMASSNMQEKCANNVPKENNQIYWLWSESSALYPSVYSSKSLTTKQLAGLIRGRINEAARVRRNRSPILPYFWFRYRDGGFLSETDLQTALKTMYKSSASGFIIWGSSNDVNTVAKCKKLLNYVENTFGPAIAKYVKSVPKFEDEMTTEFTTYNTDKLTTDVTNTDQYNATFDVALNLTSTTYEPTQTSSETDETQSVKSQTDEIKTSYDTINPYSSTIGELVSTSTTTYQPILEREESEETDSQTNDQIITKQYSDTTGTINVTNETHQTTQENTGFTETVSISSQSDDINTNYQFVTINTDNYTTQSVSKISSPITQTSPSGEENTNTSTKETTFIEMLLNALSNSKIPFEESNTTYSTAAPSTYDLTGISNESTNKLSTSSPIFEVSEETKGITLSDLILTGNTQNIKTEITSPSTIENTNDEFVEYITETNNISSASENTGLVLGEETNAYTDVSTTSLSSTTNIQNIRTQTDDFEDFVTYSEATTSLDQQNITDDNIDPNINEITTDVTDSEFDHKYKHNDTESSSEINTETNDLVSPSFIVSSEIESSTDTFSNNPTNNTVNEDVDYIIVNEDGNVEEDSSQSSENIFTIDKTETTTDKAISDLYDVSDFLTQMQADTSLTDTETIENSSFSTNSLDKVVVYIL